MSSISDESYSCLKCSYESDGAIKRCPRCGYKMSSARRIRQRGWVLVSLGLLIIIIVGVSVIMMAGAWSADVPQPVHHGTVRVEQKVETGAVELTPLVPIGRGRGEQKMGTGLLMFIFGFIGLIMSFGIVSLGGGIWQIVYGKPNKHQKAIVIGLLFVFMAFQGLAQFLR